MGNTARQQQRIVPQCCASPRALSSPLFLLHNEDEADEFFPTNAEHHYYESLFAHIKWHNKKQFMVTLLPNLKTQRIHLVISDLADHVFEYRDDLHQFIKVCCTITYSMQIVFQQETATGCALAMARHVHVHAKGICQLCQHVHVTRQRCWYDAFAHSSTGHSVATSMWNFANAICTRIGHSGTVQAACASDKKSAAKPAATKARVTKDTRFGASCLCQTLLDYLHKTLLVSVIGFFILCNIPDNFPRWSSACRLGCTFPIRWWCCCGCWLNCFSFQNVHWFFHGNGVPYPLRVKGQSGNMLAMITGAIMWLLLFIGVSHDIVGRRQCCKFGRIHHSFIILNVKVLGKACC